MMKITENMSVVIFKSPRSYTNNIIDNVLKIIINGYIKIDFVYVSLFSSVRFKNK